MIVSSTDKDENWGLGRGSQARLCTSSARGGCVAGWRQDEECGGRCHQTEETVGARVALSHGKGCRFCSECTQKPLQNFKLKILFLKIINPVILK